MKILIVGCGYLGMRVGRLLIDRGERVFATTRSAERAVELEGAGFEPVVLDVTRPETSASPPDVSHVMHCVGFDRAAGRSLREVRVDGLKRLCSRLVVGSPRLVYASTTGVYGQDDGGWVDETSPCVPTNESGRVGLEAEDVVRDFAATTGATGVVLRFAGLYGPGRVVRRGAIERGEAIVGEPSKYLNLIHIDDAARAAVAALSEPNPSALYNVCDDRPVSRKEYYTTVARLLAAPAPTFVAPTPGSPEAAREGSHKRVSNRLMKAGLLAELRYPDIDAGLPASLGEDC